MCLFSRSLLGLRRELFPLEIFIESAEREAAIDPDLPIVDPHHHLFDARCDDKGWPVSDLTIKVLYALKPGIAAKVIGGSQDERVIRTFSNLMPAIVPYMENGMLRDVSNARHQGDWPMTEDEDDEDDDDDGKQNVHGLGHYFQITCHFLLQTQMSLCVLHLAANATCMWTILRKVDRVGTTFACGRPFLTLRLRVDAFQF